MPPSKVATAKWTDLLAGRTIPPSIVSPPETSKIRKIVSERSIQSLWAGYGHVFRLEAEMEDGSRRNLIAKQVNPPQASGIGHERKLHSYAVEACFYKTCAASLLSPPTSLPVPQPVYVNAADNEFTFVLTDLTDDHLYPVAISWLARLHAHYWERVDDLDGLWECGSYWHLETRQEEFESMGREWADLKAVAPRVDSLLRGMQPDGSFSKRHQTVIHGDMKAANIVFSSGGRAFGSRDLIMLFCSSANARDLEDPSTEKALLQHYHSTLLDHLEARSRAEGYAGQADSPSPTDFSFEDLLVQFDLALVDYHRPVDQKPSLRPPASPSLHRGHALRQSKATHCAQATRHAVAQHHDASDPTGAKSKATHCAQATRHADAQHHHASDPNWAIRSNKRSVILGMLSLAVAPLAMPSGATADIIEVDINKVLEVIKHDFVENQYYTTGNLTASAYEPNCNFIDPTTNVKGVAPYTKAVASLFDATKSRADLISISVVDLRTIKLRWRLEGALKIADLRIKPYTGTTLYTLDDKGLISKHEETWDISAADAFLSTVIPGFGAPPAPPVPTA
eukprot:gene26411-17510_t